MRQQVAFDNVLYHPVAELGLTLSCHTALSIVAINRIADLVGRSREDILKIPGMGRHRLAEIERCLAKQGFRLRLIM